jgi:hypothetical protein
MAVLLYLNTNCPAIPVDSSCKMHSAGADVLERCAASELFGNEDAGDDKLL